MAWGDGMLVWAGDILVNERRQLQENAAPGMTKPAGLLYLEKNGRDEKRQTGRQALHLLWTIKTKRQSRKRGTRNLELGFNGKLYAMIWDVNHIINYINYCYA